MTRNRCCRDGVLTCERFSLADVSEHLEDESQSYGWTCAPQGPRTWRSLPMSSGSTPSRSRPPPVARQRPKFDRFPGHDFLTAYALRLT